MNLTNCLRNVLLTSAIIAASAGQIAKAQEVALGSTKLTLGMSADEAVRLLSKEFILQPKHGIVQTWWVQSRHVERDTTYRIDGQIVAKNGRLSSIMKIISPEHPSAVSVGESFFSLLERIAGPGRDCHVAVTRTGLESGAGAGGTILNASLHCGVYTGVIMQVQGGEGMSHDVTIQYSIASSP